MNMQMPQIRQDIPPTCHGSSQFPGGAGQWHLPGLSSQKQTHSVDHPLGRYAITWWHSVFWPQQGLPRSRSQKPGSHSWQHLLLQFHQTLLILSPNMSQVHLHFSTCIIILAYTTICPHSNYKMASNPAYPIHIFLLPICSSDPGLLSNGKPISHFNGFRLLLEEDRLTPGGQKGPLIWPHPPLGPYLSLLDFSFPGLISAPHILQPLLSLSLCHYCHSLPPISLPHPLDLSFTPWHQALGKY